MWEGKPAKLTWHKAFVCAAAIVAFSLLTVLFLFEKYNLGVEMCTANLGLRAIEVVRVIQLHYRPSQACGHVDGDEDKEDPLLHKARQRRPFVA
jgi:hypothetical protein